MDIKFVSYDGSYPCLCFGTLAFTVNGKEYRIDSRVSSGGSVSFDEDWCVHVTSGPLSISEYDIPDKIRGLRHDIEVMMNDNVPHGCCGGCVK